LRYIYIAAGEVGRHDGYQSHIARAAYADGHTNERVVIRMSGDTIRHYMMLPRTALLRGYANTLMSILRRAARERRHHGERQDARGLSRRANYMVTLSSLMMAITWHEGQQQYATYRHHHILLAMSLSYARRRVTLPSPTLFTMIAE